jgi:hypothetical protein
MAVVAGSEGEVERLLAALRGMAEDLSGAVVSRWDDQVIEGVG